LGPTVFDAIRRTPRTAMRDEYEITETIQVMIDAGDVEGVSECIVDDINVTTPRDLLRCNLMEVARQPEQVVSGAGLALAPGARLERSVLGHNVAIQHPITVRDSLIFDNTMVGCTTDLVNSIVLPDCIVDCQHDTASVRENA
jgi:dTDP-glucose pyrophosphorylase